MNIVFVSAGDVQGGGNLVGYRLHQHFQKLNGHSLMLVSVKGTRDESVRVINFSTYSRWTHWCESLRKSLEKHPFKGSWFDIIGER